MSPRWQDPREAPAGVVIQDARSLCPSTTTSAHVASVCHPDTVLTAARWVLQASSHTDRKGRCQAYQLRGSTRSPRSHCARFLVCTSLARQRPRPPLDGREAGRGAFCFSQHCVWGNPRRGPWERLLDELNAEVLPLQEISNNQRMQHSSIWPMLTAFQPPGSPCCPRWKLLGKRC